MKGFKIALSCLLGLMLSSGCRHIIYTRARFYENAAVRYPASETVTAYPYPSCVKGKHIVLAIARGIDEIRRAIDDEDYEHLHLELKDYTVGKKMRIPSENVTPYFMITRFGPTSYGRSFKGYLIVRRASDDRIDVYLNLVVQSSTVRKTPLETSIFRGDYTFLKAKVAADSQIADQGIRA